MLMTVSQLAKKFNISRTSILYYEKKGLLSPSSRSTNGYRQYGEKEVARLKDITAYRSYGLSIQHISTLLDIDDDSTQQHILHNQFNALEYEIQKLRQQQKSIVAVLKKHDQHQRLNKERWTAIMHACGCSIEDMKNWHIQFEKMEPKAHQAFLESLNIDDEEITMIRSWRKDSTILKSN